MAFPATCPAHRVALLALPLIARVPSLLAATEADLAKIAAACARARRPLRGKDKIALRVGKVRNRRKVAKHFTIDIGDDRFSYARDPGSIAAEAALDAIYVLRTSVTDGDLGGGEVVSSYKAIAHVKRAFRAINTDLDIRPHPPPHRAPGPRPRVFADTVVPHHLAHAGTPRAHAVPRG